MVCQKICASQKEGSKNKTVVDIILHKPQPYTYPYSINNDRFQSSSSAIIGHLEGSQYNFVQFVQGLQNQSWLYKLHIL